MAKVRKSGWKYFFNEFFNEEFAIHEETGWIYFNTAHGIVKYSPEELKLFKDNGAAIDIATHKVKTIFGGEIVGIEQTKKTKPVVIPGELEIL
jgi:hypothetical protein